MNRITWHFFILLCSVGSSLWAQTQYAFGVKEAVNYGLQNHGNIKLATFDEFIAQKQVAGFEGLAYPQISANSTLQGNIERPQFILAFAPGQPPQKVPVGQTWQHVGQVQLSQLIFDGGFLVGLEGVKELRKLTQLNTQRTENELITQIVTAYYTVLVTKENAKVLDLNQTRLEKLYKDTDAMFRNGLVEKTDLERIQLSLNNLKIERNKFDRMAELTLEVLKFQMGMSPDAKLVLTDALPDIDMEKEDWQNMESFDFTKRIEYNIMSQQAKLEGLNIKRYKLSRLPSIAGFLYYQYNMQSSDKVFEFTDKTTFGASAAGLRINIPIFDGFQSKNEIQKAQINIKKIEISQQMLENGLRMQQENTLANLRNAWDSHKAQVENLALAKTIFDRAQLKYKEGVGSSLELNNAEVAYKEAERNLLSTNFEYLTARLKLWDIKGELKERFK